MALYVTDFEKQWDALLDDIALAPLGDRDATVQRLYVLSSPQSPMRDLLAGIARELTLAAPDAAKSPPDKSPPGKAMAGVIGQAVAAEPPQGQQAGTAIEQHYADLRTLVGDGQASAPLGNLLHLINGFQADLAQSGPTGNVAASVQGGASSLQLLRAEAQRQPKPVSRWLQQIVDSGHVALTGSAQAAAAAAFGADTGPGEFCKTVVAGRYPFDPASSNDAPFDDFARLFAPGGLLDAFFQTQIAPYVDTSGGTWRFRPLGGVKPPVDAASLARVQRAAAIRDAFFPNGGTTPQLRFTLAPLSLGPGVARATVTLGGARIVDIGHQAPPTALTWPGTDGMTSSAIMFEPDASAPPPAATGVWALFRLLDRAQATPGSTPEAFRLDFKAGERQASFSLEAGSTRNPIGRNLLEGFRCPEIR
jgi:type VI secretion system protein ImpL